MTELSEFLLQLPKAELHLHLEGTLEPDLKFALARRNGISLAQTTVEQVRETYRFNDLTSFLSVYYPAMDVLRTAPDFADLAYHYLRRAHLQGVRYVEMFFDPQAHTARGVSFDDIIRGYRSGILRAGREFGIDAELILCFLRDLGADYAMATLSAALPYKKWIIGVGLDSDERGNPPNKFAEVFARARTEGFLLTMHCDVDQQDSLEHIRQVIEDIGVDRIDHGTNIIESPELVTAAKQRGLALTCCPVSNSFVTGEPKIAELLHLHAAGLTMTVNSDDPAYFGAYAGDNYIRLAESGQVDRDTLINLARNSFHAAWLTPGRRERYLAELDDHVATNS
ncbi:adenosine deaminase [Nocardia takedensis]|uniref:adenosine deaminase n=1 Tax=Nocardia takedensis TaxID=259390 RepID=UPI0002EB1990|nr:adenosine deaminase [Nocardia takedensis]